MSEGSVELLRAHYHLLELPGGLSFLLELRAKLLQLSMQQLSLLLCLFCKLALTLVLLQFCFLLHQLL